MKKVNHQHCQPEPQEEQLIVHTCKYYKDNYNYSDVLGLSVKL